MIVVKKTVILHRVAIISIVLVIPITFIPPPILFVCCTILSSPSSSSSHPSFSCFVSCLPGEAASFFQLPHPGSHGPFACVFVVVGHCRRETSKGYRTATL